MCKNLQRLPQGYYFRQAIPADLRPTVGARELRIALGTSVRAEAELRGSILRPFVSRLLRQLRENNGSMDVRDIRAHAVAHCNRQLEALGQLRSWPHTTVKESLKKLYGFASDYPGIRHGVNSAGRIRGIETRDLAALSIMLMG